MPLIEFVYCENSSRYNAKEKRRNVLGAVSLHGMGSTTLLVSKYISHLSPLFDNEEPLNSQTDIYQVGVNLFTYSLSASHK